MRFVFTGGGTGGHVYPALAVATALRELDRTAQIYYAGNPAGVEAELAGRAGLPFERVTSGAILGRSPLAVGVSVGKIGMGFGQSIRMLRRLRPQAILATGGYVCVPIVLAAWALRVRRVLLLPDVHPGLAIRALAPFSSTVALAFEEARSRLRARHIEVTGYPVRAELVAARRDASRAQFGLDPNGNVTLVLGGSRGARSINEAIARHLPELLEFTELVHASGPLDFGWLEQRAAALPADRRSRYRLYRYLHEELAAALAAADLVIARAGAATLGEFPTVGVPAILVPYPHAGAHQRLNADYLASRGAAIRLDDERLPSGALLDTVRSVLTDRARLTTLAERARALGRPNAAREIAELLLDGARGGAEATGREQARERERANTRFAPTDGHQATSFRPMESKRPHTLTQSRADTPSPRHRIAPSLVRGGEEGPGGVARRA